VNFQRKGIHHRVHRGAQRLAGALLFAPASVYGSLLVHCLATH
jgi:hypothetical protein